MGLGLLSFYFPCCPTTAAKPESALLHHLVGDAFLLTLIWVQFVQLGAECNVLLRIDFDVVRSFSGTSPEELPSLLRSPTFERRFPCTLGRGRGPSSRRFPLVVLFLIPSFALFLFLF